jgi:hypothetical protein
MKTTEELAEIKTALKTANKVVYELEVPIDEDETIFATLFLKKPDRSILSMLTALINKGDMYRAIDAFLKAVYIGGDELSIVTTNDDALIACESAVVQMIERKKVTLKKS